MSLRTCAPGPAATRPWPRGSPGPCSRATCFSSTGTSAPGKTTFTQGLARAMGVGDPVTSPTFTLIRSYPTAFGVELIHADVYRLDRLSEIVALGLPEMLEDGAVAVIEWGGRAAPALGPDTSTSAFTPTRRRARRGTPGRALSWPSGSAGGRRWPRLLQLAAVETASRVAAPMTVCSVSPPPPPRWASPSPVPTDPWRPSGPPGPPARRTAGPGHRDPHPYGRDRTNRSAGSPSTSAPGSSPACGSAWPPPRRWPPPSTCRSSAARRWTCWPTRTAARPAVASVVDAKRGEVFWGLFRPGPEGDEGVWSRSTTPRSAAPRSGRRRCESGGRVLAVGDGARRYADSLALLPGVELAEPRRRPSRSRRFSWRLAAARASVPLTRSRPLVLAGRRVRIGWEQRPR